MLILLPPSEGKDSPVRGRPLSMADLSFPALTAAREAVAAALVRLCDGPAAKARATLGITARQEEELRRNRALLTAPAAPAAQIYSGVLYDALDLATLPARPARRATTDIAIASALFGLLRITDRIPAYRLSGDTSLPGVGRLAAAWREPMGQAIAETAGSGVVLDLRSSAYVALGPVPAELSQRTAVARVLQERGGRRTVVSHHNKATKGRMVRSLLAQPRPKTIPDLAGILGASGHRVELQPPVKDGLPWTIDVVVSEV